MKRLLMLAALVTIPMFSHAQDLRLFDSAMAQVGLTHEDIRFDQDEMATWGGDAWRLSYFTMFHNNPLKLPKYGQMNLEAYSTICGSITALITDAGRKIDCPVRRGLIGDPLEQYTKHDSGSAIPRKPNSGLPAGQEYTKLGDKIVLLRTIVGDRSFSLSKVYENLASETKRQQLFAFFVTDSQAYNDLAENLVREFDFNRMVAGAEDIAELLRRIADSVGQYTFPLTRTEIPTKQGLIIIGTKGNDEFVYSTPPLLILDPGGDDTYRISGYMHGYPMAAIIDVAGNDKYLSQDSTSPGIGGAVLGLSVVIDKAGDDFYSARNVAQGCGIFGVGAVIDNNGNDTYSAKLFSQGSAAFGIGILADSTGNDSLYCWANSQGYGYTKGCGLCINYSGQDIYIAEDSIIFSPGQQTQEHNSSLAQGAAFGKRADYVDGHSWAGGVGILCDISGDDKYRSGLFAQGCGYWFAVGMLLDGAGNDDYLSPWYTLGSGAHFAVGYLDDFAGNDSYNATMAMSIGSGHDFTVGYFNERGGNDVYHIPGLSAGGGNFQGIGIFHDWSGDDSYTTSGKFILGGAQGLRQGPRAYLRTLGIFIDGSGDDTYKEPFAKNMAMWVSPKSDTANPDSHEIGVGIDK